MTSMVIGHAMDVQPTTLTDLDHLREGILVVLCTNRKFGNRVFSVSGPFYTHAAGQARHHKKASYLATIVNYV